jgi:hypothetical protein
MAIQTRYAGDANGVVNVDNSNGAVAGFPITPGLTKAPTLIAIANSTTGANLALETNTGGAVETVLRALQIDGTVTMYQVQPQTGSALMSVYLEATGIHSGEQTSSTSEGAYIQTNAQIATAVQNRLTALLGAASAVAGPTGTTTGGNIGISSNVWANNFTVTNVGFKLATS